MQHRLLINSIGPRIEYAHYNKHYPMIKGMKVFKYNCKYKTDYSHGEHDSELICWSEKDFLDLIAVWNRMNPNQYNYTPIRENNPHQFLLDYWVARYEEAWNDYPFWIAKNVTRAINKRIQELQTLV